MGRLSEKQLLLVIVAATLLLVGAFGGLAYWDHQRIYAAEVTEEHPEAAEISDQNEWGERRKIQELEKQIAAARAEAELIPKREQDVIVYREIVARDAAILPSEEEVNRLATTIGDFEKLSGVQLTRVADLNTASAAGAAIARMPFKLELSGTFDQVLKFINLFETLDRLVNVTSFSIAAGLPERDGREVTARHSVSLDLVTFMYTSNAGLAKPVEIANYDRRKNDPVIQKMIRQQKAAYVEKYQLKPRVNRRDPLIDPRRSAEEAEDGSGDVKDADAQRRLVEKLRFDVEGLKDDVRQEAFYIQEHKLVPLSQLKILIDNKVGKLEADVRAAEPRVTIPELKEILQRDVIEPFQAIKAERDLQVVPQFISRTQVEEFRDQMRTQMDAFDFKGGIRTHDNFLALVNGREVNEDAASIVQDMVDMRRLAEVQLGFEALRLRYSGAILRSEGSVILVNGHAKRIGDFVDERGKCRVVEITKDFVVYDFDGFEIKDPVNKK